MKKKKTDKNYSTHLRKRALEILRQRPDDLSNLSKDDIDQIVHELGIYQIELEMQNEDLRKTQVELEHSRQEYADLYDFGPVGYLSLNTKGIIQKANLAAATILGQKRASLVKKPFSKFVAREDADAYHQYHRKILETRRQEECELKMARGNSSHFWIYTKCSPIWDLDDQITGVRSVIVDITDRKQAEAAIQSLALFPQENSNPVIRASGEGKLLYANPAAITLLELLKWQEGSPLPEPMTKLSRQAMTSGSKCEFELTCALNRIYSFIATPIASQMYVNLYGHEITARKHAELVVLRIQDTLESQVQTRTEELARAVELLEAMLANTHMCIAYMDTSFNFIRVNYAYAATTGYSPEYYVGKNYFSLHPNAVNENETIFRETVQAGQQIEFREKPVENPYQPESGVTYWDGTLRPLKNGLGEVEGLLLNQIDVTKRVLFTKQIDAERKKLFAVLNMLPGYAVIKGPDYLPRFSSHGYLEAFGDLANRPCYEIQCGRSKPCNHCPIPRILDTKQPEDFESSYPNGKTFHVWSFPFLDVDGTDVVLQLGFDVTEQKRTQLEITEISETERRRIGRDLHDTLGQQLTSVGYLVSGLMSKFASISPQDKSTTNRIIEAINNSVCQVRALARGLDPMGLEEDGFIAVLRELTENINNLSNVSCDLKCIGSLQLDSYVGTHLYHLCQEATNNALKHSQTKHISISLTRNDDELVLSVEDEGIGLPTSLSDSKGMGLRIMKYRAGAIGANLTIEPRYSGGTIVQCALKLPSDQSNGGD